MSNLITISGVRGFIDENGTAHLSLEDVARGLGFTRVATSGNEVVRWERVEGYLREFGVPTCGHDDFIPENIVYRLGFKASNDVAEKFQAKLADEILPSIRKHGIYATDNVIEKVLDDPDFGIKLLSQLKEERQKRQEAEQVIEQQKPLVGFAEHVSESNNSILVRELAKVASKHNILIGEKRLYKTLREWGMIFKNSTEPKQEYVDRGYFEVVEGVRETSKGTFTHRTTRVTGKGQIYIIGRLKKELNNACINA